MLKVDEGTAKRSTFNIHNYIKKRLTDEPYLFLTYADIVEKYQGVVFKKF